MTRTTFALIAAATAAVAARANDWPQFRGPNGAGVAPAAGLPDRWGPAENVRWKADLPGRGVSSPVVAGGRVFLTANSGLRQTRLHVLAIDAASGRRLWERQFWATGQTNCHPKTCMAAPTPVTDGRHVYALFATCDLVCLDIDGNVVWVRSLQSDYPRMVNHVGRGASPVLADGVLVVPLESQGASYVLGLDPRTGGTVWKVERPTDLNFTTPLVVRRGGKAEVLMQSPSALTAFDPKTGRALWTFDAEKLSGIPSPAVYGDLVLAPLERGMVALRPRADGPPEVVWKSLKLATFTPSPLVAEGKVYALKGDILVCGEAADGKVHWEQRLKGPFSASPVLSDGKLYLVNEEGVTTVVRPRAKFEAGATNDLKDPMLASPAVAGGVLYLRSDRYLYCIGTPNTKG